MKDLRVTQEDLKKPLGVSTRGAVGHYLSGRRDPSMDQMMALASYLRCDLGWLMEGSKGSKREYKQGQAPASEVREPAMIPESLTHVPLISWVTAGSWAEACDPYEPGDAEEMIAVTRKVGSRAFALKITGDSMEPRFPAGGIIVVDPEVRAENGSYVVARLDDTNEVTFKQLVIDGGKRFLKPLNNRYPIIEVNGNATEVGVVRQLVMDID